MLRTRVMPCLLLKESALVKTENFKSPRYVGDPINAVRIFNQKEVDELILLDINASSQNKAINFELIEQIASECFMPIAYGGGVKTVDDFRKLFALGIEKVSISSAAIDTPELITQAAEIFGSQSVVVTIDVKKTRWLKKQRVWKHSGRIKTDLAPVEFAAHVESLGAGEIIVNSIEKDGTWSGYDLELLKSISGAVNIPVVACGGAGKLSHLSEAVNKGGASALALGSMAVFQAKDLGVLIKFPKPKELEELLS